MLPHRSSLSLSHPKRPIPVGRRSSEEPTTTLQLQSKEGGSETCSHCQGHPEPDTLSSSSTDSLWAQLHHVTWRLDDVQKEVRELKEECEMTPLGGSLFTQEIRACRRLLGADGVIREKGLLRMSNPLKGLRDPTNYCCFHRDYDLDTKDCHNLRNHIEELIRCGYLGCHVWRPRDPSPRPWGPVEKQINVIVGGPVSRGDNTSGWRAYA
ncbi:hypothetical protein GW17_00058989 [Ensete ventricosum]|nr:hypothetical protein GW17_00058989 [Ensete ventricosum]